MALENTLPDILEFTGNIITQGDFKVALNKLILYLNEVLGADGSKAIPSGIICLWSGSVDNIPDGWALCNGGFTGQIRCRRGKKLCRQCDRRQYKPERQSFWKHRRNDVDGQSDAESCAFV